MGKPHTASATTGAAAAVSVVSGEAPGSPSLHHKRLRQELGIPLDADPSKPLDALEGGLPTAVHAAQQGSDHPQPCWTPLLWLGWAEQPLTTPLVLIRRPHPNCRYAHAHGHAARSHSHSRSRSHTHSVSKLSKQQREGYSMLSEEKSVHNGFTGGGGTAAVTAAAVAGAPGVQHSMHSRVKQEGGAGATEVAASPAAAKTAAAAAAAALKAGQHVEVLKQGCWWPCHVMDVSWEAAATGGTAATTGGDGAHAGPAAGCDAPAGEAGAVTSPVTAAGAGAGPASSLCTGRTVQCVLVRNALPPEADGTVWRAAATAVR